MRRDRRTREQRKADASARIAAVCLFLAALLILFAVLTVKTTGQPYKGEPPVVEDKLPGEDKPAEGSAVLTIGEPLGEFRLTAYCPCMKCCGKTDGITSTGTTAAEGRTIAVDPRVIPYGSAVTIYFPTARAIHTPPRIAAARSRRTASTCSLTTIRPRGSLASKPLTFIWRKTMDNLNGYKAFEPGMICKGKQYRENTDYEEEGGEIREKE